MMARARSKTTVRYAFDEANRLLVSEPLRPTRRVEGRLTIEPGNRLVYLVEAPGPTADAVTPHAYHLDGAWALTPNHELALTLHESAVQDRQTVYLKGALTGTEAHALVFALRRREDDDVETAQRLSLSGRWQADAQNRLTFLIEHADGVENRLTLEGGWETDEHHALRYRYRQRSPAFRDRDQHTLVFEGAWDVTGSDRLVYRLTGSDDSAFEFTASLRSPSLLAKDGRIEYEVGVGLSRMRTERQRVALFGAWKLNRDLSVSFEMPYAGGRVQAIRFEGAARLGPRDQVAVALTHARGSPPAGARGKPLGLTVTFTRELVPDASLFLRLRADAEERSALAGVHVRF